MALVLLVISETAAGQLSSRAVADAVPLPIFIYENPKYSGISIAPPFAQRMKEEIPTIRGIKVAYGAGAMLDWLSRTLSPP